MSDLCADKTVFLDAYERATGVLSLALTELRLSMGTLSREQYEAAYKRTEELRMQAREAQEKLLRHVAAHGC